MGDAGVPGRGVAPTRRGLLGSGAVALAGLSVAGCDLVSTEPEQPEQPDQRTGRGATRGTEKDREAPDLARQVEAGTLPALDRRLPDQPLVVEPTERAGGYGGTLHMALTLTENAAMYCMVAYDNLLRWTEKWTGAPGTKELTPNLAESFEVNGEATEFTFHLRKGTRWSDGHPFTVDDVVFAVSDVLLNTDLYPVAPSILTVDKGTATIEKLSETSFRLTFPSPAGTFLQEVATWDGRILTYYPRHYLKRFHKGYATGLDKLAKDEGFSTWVDLFLGKAANYGENADLPGLAAWRLTTPFGSGQRVELERNPYYWKVDPAGRQLPYIDRVVFDVVNDTQTMLLKTLHGDEELEAGPDQRITSPANKPVFARNRDRGDYRFVDAEPVRMNVMSTFLNLTHEDPVKRAIFRAKDFRVALSHAIDREEIVAATMQRQGEPYQVAPLPHSAFYDEELAMQYLDHDVATADGLLDRLHPERNGDGIRLGPDGQPIVITVEYSASFRDVWSNILELVQRYWRRVGIDTRLKNEDLALLGQRRDANKHDATIWQGDGGVGVLLSTGNYLPIGAGNRMAPLWGLWYDSGGAEGERPPDPVRRQMALYDRMRSSSDPGQQRALMTRLLQITREQFYAIGIAREVGAYLVAANGLRNLPERMIQGFVYPTPGPTRTEQYYLT